MSNGLDWKQPSACIERMARFLLIAETTATLQRSTLWALGAHHFLTSLTMD